MGFSGDPCLVSGGISGFSGDLRLVSGATHTFSGEFQHRLFRRLRPQEITSNLAEGAYIALYLKEEAYIFRFFLFFLLMLANLKVIV
ncbi:hypothetical protein PVA17_18060 [Lysinibacillus sp. CNPSo 3705]|uniref:hypothetical protein n=1 Tax=Lysinibacillus sp. CNPSo 3705 TaxID=3028148 RepID=UPI002363C81C|nr:hypothetical protein [Lysinibacillus sp. CNPSo 3705]MDD1504650.1 hypothetical protein [Lysinibacillus sp. CNPSo 3705]